MFMKAFIPRTKLVPLAGIARTVGSPSLGYPAGLPSAPEKAAAKMTEMKVNNAEKVAILASPLKVRGIEAANEMTAVMAAKPIVHMP
jgi:hypothetical protein